MNPYLLKLGIINIRWYSVIMMIAIISASFLIYRELKKEKYHKNFIENLIFYSVIYGVIGARIYYVIFNWSYYSANLLSIFKVWEGGLAIHGAIIAGLIYIYFYTKRNRQDFLKITDITVVGLILGQAIGRWGNFMNGEAYGMITSKTALVNEGVPNFIINGMKISGVYYQPTFLYESIWAMILLAILLMVRNQVKIKIGTLTSIYLVGYGLIRFFTEAMRSDSLMLGNLKIAQFVSIMMITIGLVGYLYIRNQKRKFYHKKRVRDHVEKLDL